MSELDRDAVVALFPDEIVTRALVRDIALPGGAGTMALVTLDNGKDHTRPTTFGPQGMFGMLDCFTELKKRAEAGEIQAVAVTGKPFIFAVGADLGGVGKMTSREQAKAIAKAGHDAFGTFSDIPVPSFAFVNGATMGGGVEMALSAAYRTISTGAAAIALPECFLGIIPGWGGCWRTPNLIGAENALKVIVENPLSNNKMLKPADALELGLADVMFEAADFLEESILWAAKVVSGEITVDRPEVDTSEETWAAAVAKARAVADGKTGGTAPAPYAAIDIVEAARVDDRATGFAKEDEALADLLTGDVARAGLYAFDLIQRRAKRPEGAPAANLAAKVSKVGIVGAGLMASQMALLFIQRMKVPVVMTDLDQERVDKGVAYVHTELDKQAKKGRLTADSVNRYKALITGSTSKADFADAEFVIEAVFEEMGVKQTVFAECEAVVSPECILATNTSSLSISEMAAKLEHPERVVGFHFFNPVAVMPLLEIIKGNQTSDAALATAFATGKALKKTCILVKDSPSFIVNRLLGRFMGEVGRVVDQGTPVEVADEAFAGLAPMPPFQLIGLVGPAIALHNGETLAKAFPDRFYVSEGLKNVVEAKKFGFYRWNAAGQPEPDPDVIALLPKPANPVVLTAAEVREKVLSALAEEARLMLDEGVAQAPMDIDLGMITGAGFTFWNGGITPLLDRSGVAEKVTGKRFLPAGVASMP